MIPALDRCGLRYFPAVFLNLEAVLLPILIFRLWETKHNLNLCSNLLDGQYDNNLF